MICVKLPIHTSPRMMIVKSIPIISTDVCKFDCIQRDTVKQETTIGMFICIFLQNIIMYAIVFKHMLYV